jgi:hypothetical protein
MKDRQNCLARRRNPHRVAFATADLERLFSHSASFNLDELAHLAGDNMISLSRTMRDPPRQSSSPRLLSSAELYQTPR